ncbi:hypothetical protein GCM10020001_066460 [Nonomuraea salmonea]
MLLGAPAFDLARLVLVLFGAPAFELALLVLVRRPRPLGARRRDVVGRGRVGGGDGGRRCLGPGCGGQTR